jgi:hypothetical protein
MHQDNRGEVFSTAKVIILVEMVPCSGIKVVRVGLVVGYVRS